MHAGGGGMNALPPSGSPAACVRGAGRRGPRPIGPCAGTAAKSGARPSAQGALGPRRPASFTAAETQNGAVRLRVTGAGGATGRGGTLARARAAAHIHPLKAARYANRATWHGVTGSGNNMPRGGPPVCAAGAARRRPVMPPAATGAPGTRPNAQEKKAKNARSRQRYARRRARRLCSDCGASSQGASRCPPCARRSWARSGEHRGLPVLPPRFTVIEIATGVNHGTWERWEDVVMCLAFAKLSRDQVELIPDM